MVVLGCDILPSFIRLEHNPTVFHDCSNPCGYTLRWTDYSAKYIFAISGYGTRYVTGRLTARHSLFDGCF